jgi:predicted glutamine amidotransferase
LDPLLHYALASLQWKTRLRGTPVLSFRRRPIFWARMCRLLAYSGEPILLADLLLRPEHSLVAQSAAAREDEDRVHADGFGVGWYQREISPFPALFRSVQPAWSSANLRGLASLTRSDCFFAHVRAASPGIEVAEANCHPFAFGPFLWMHNGTLGGFPDFREWARRFLSRAAFAPIRGTTDSEHLFALFLEGWMQAGEPRDPETLLDAFRKALTLALDIQRQGGVAGPSTLNLALTDGATTIVCRLATGAEKPLSLWLARGVRQRTGAPALFSVDGSGQGGTIVASERLFPHPQWEEVPPGQAVLVRQGAGAVLVHLE